MSFLLGLLYEILTSVFYRVLNYLFRDKFQKFLRRLKARLNQIKTGAFSEKEITQWKIIKDLHPSVINKKKIKQRIISALAEGGCISKNDGRDKNFHTILSLDIDGACLHIDPILEELIPESFIEDTKNQRVSCIVILPAPRKEKTVSAPDFIRYLNDKLGSPEIPLEFISHGMLIEQIPAKHLTRTKKDETILVIQPVAFHDKYLDHCLEFIERKSMSNVCKVLTIIDPTERAETEKRKNPDETVLIELNLNETGK